jgi:NADH-quinone oxidoreductase subunit C/D
VSETAVSDPRAAGAASPGPAVAAPPSGQWPSRFWGEAKAAAALAEVPTVRVLREKHPEAVLAAADALGDLSLTVRRDELLKVARTLRDHADLQYWMLQDVCGLDRSGLPGGDADRFHAVYHLYSPMKGKRVRLHVPLGAADPEVDSLTPLWASANWAEREAYDMYGIRFSGHPDLRRILCHQEFVGHPLRKDYPTDRRHMLSRTYSSFPGLPPDLPEGQTYSVMEGDVERVYINLGPSHPTTHGAFRIQARLDGEIMEETRSEVGYLHRCFEKMCEAHTFTQIIPFTDRLNYVSAFNNNVGYAMAVEKLLGLELPERAVAIRVVLMEFNRIMDHFVTIGANLVDLGALTNFWYAFRPREEIYELLEACCGARLTVSYGRIGGVAQDVPENFVAMAKRLNGRLPEFLGYIDKLITKNVIFQRRTRDVGILPKERALSYGWGGPMLRSTGVQLDVRRTHPYYGYDQLDWEVPVRQNGDVFDRYVIRMEEIRQSMKIIRQALERFPTGRHIVDDWTIALPPKNEVYTNIEALMAHFKLTMHGPQVPPGEVYSYTESPVGELGFYLVTDGGPKPHRLHCRAPGFYTFAAFDEMCKGAMLSDFVANLGSLAIIAGELDR